MSWKLVWSKISDLVHLIDLLWFFKVGENRCENSENGFWPFLNSDFVLLLVIQAYTYFSVDSSMS